MEPSSHGFRVGMKLEAVDKENSNLICVATVRDVLGNFVLVHFDDWEDIYDYWCDAGSPFLHPVGWCQKNGVALSPPKSKKESQLNRNHSADVFLTLLQIGKTRIRSSGSRTS